VSEKINLRDLQKQQTRLKLMNSAMSLFAEVGYEEVTLAEIADHAQIHVQTLYKHFKTKSNLETSYFDLYLDMAITRLDALDNEQNILEELEKAILAILDTMMKTEYVLPMFQMIHANDDLLASTQHRLRLFEDHLAQKLQLQQDHSFSEIEAKMLSAMMVSSYRDAHFSWIRSNGLQSSTEKLQDYLKYIKTMFHLE